MIFLSNLEPNLDEFLPFTLVDGSRHNRHNLDQLMHWFRRKAPRRETFEKISCPVLIFEGTTDKAVSPDDAAKQWYDALVNGTSHHLSKLSNVH